MLNKKVWLDFLYYNVGKQQYDFRLNGLKRQEDGSVFSTKWKKYSGVCFPLNPWEDNKIIHINNREILPIEVVIDLEDADSVDDVIEKLKEDGLPFYAFHSGSRGFHIHIFLKEALTTEQKLSLIKRYGGDEMKAHNGTTIALEYAKHWKTGKIKREYKNG